MSFEKIVIAALSAHEDAIMAPPERVLEVEAIGGVIMLTTRRVGESGVPAVEPDSVIEVIAGSLLIAVQACIDDENLPQPGRLGGMK